MNNHKIISCGFGKISSDSLQIINSYLSFSELVDMSLTSKFIKKNTDHIKFNNMVIDMNKVNNDVFDMKVKEIFELFLNEHQNINKFKNIDSIKTYKYINILMFI